MPRYLVQRNFKDGLVTPVSEEGATTCRVVVDNDAGLDVTWVHSYVSQDKSVSYCVYDGPSPGAIRKAAELNGLPVGQITEVTVLDPYFLPLVHDGFGPANCPAMTIRTGAGPAVEKQGVLTEGRGRDGPGLR